jgi:hypothetical protein
MPSFKNSCFEAAKRFVQTVVVIDDQAGYPDDKTKKSPSPPVISPLTGLTTPSDSEPIAPEENCIPDQADLDEAFFDINLVVNGFAELKITCSVQRPDYGAKQQQKDELKKWAVDCAGRSDIAIIDWRLCKEDSHMAEDIIIELLKRDKDTGGRIRMLCIYTRQPNPSNILNDIKKRITEDLNLMNTQEPGGLACTVDGRTRIVIFIKADSSDTDRNNATVVPFDELPDTALREFSSLVEGLIPCTVLHSISAIREQTHNLLALLNKNLDGVFCAHRALKPDIEDSIDYILDLISQEISTRILRDEAARDFLDTDSIKSWYDGQALPENLYALEKEVLWLHIKNGNVNLSDVRKQRAKAWLIKKEKSQNQLKDKDGKNINYSEAKVLIEKGFFQEINGCSPPSETNLDRFAELFYQKQAEAKQACNELSRLTCSSKDESDLRNSANDGLFLTLGSVLKVKNEDTDYIICLQPPCDSVRLEEKTVFLFLQLYNGSAGNADFIIKLHDGMYQSLSIKVPNKKPRFKTFCFTPDKDSLRVLVNKLNRKYEWVAELRPEKALTIAQKALTNASRIGFDEFEILRRKGSQL